MARLTRFVLPGAPHHVTQRGNSRQQTFFSQDNHLACRDLLARHCGAHAVTRRAVLGDDLASDVCEAIAVDGL